MKRHTTFLLLLVMFISLFSFPALASNSDDKKDFSYLERIQSIDKSFLAGKKVSFQTMNAASPWGNLDVVEFFSNATSVGVGVFSGMTVLYFSESSIDLPHNFDSEKVLYFDFGGFQLITNESADKMLLYPQDIQSFITKDNTLLKYDPSEISCFIDGFTPQRQEGYLCVLNSLSMIVWYWGGHGYPSLISNASFQTVRARIKPYFNGNYANASVPAVANQYGNPKGVSFSGQTIWTNSISYLRTEINNGYPCMVGFKKGNPHWPGYAHMTVCTGYVYEEYSDTWYIRVADGHSTSYATYIWTSYNDCTIKLRPN